MCETNDKAGKKACLNLERNKTELKNHDLFQSHYLRLTMENQVPSKGPSHIACLRHVPVQCLLTDF